MRKAAALLSVVVLACLSTVGVPAVAAMDGRTLFLRAQHPSDLMWGDPATDDQLESIGYTVCKYRKTSGMSEDRVVDLMFFRPAGFGRTNAQQRVRDAVRYICP